LPIYGISISKQSSWHINPERWDNVYHYFFAAALDVAQAQNLVDQIVAAEKSCHSSSVAFLQARVWEAGGTPSENETILIATLSGTGTMTSVQAIWKECAVVVRCETTRNTSTGRRIYLRKYYRCVHLNAAGGGAEVGIAALTTSHRAPMVAAFETLREVSVTPGPINVQLCAPGGQLVSDARPVTALPDLHVRQFRR
jgi:hypothetical protein